MSEKHDDSLTKVSDFYTSADDSTSKPIENIEKINRKNSLLVKKLIIDHFGDTAPSSSHVLPLPSLTSNLRRNASMPTKSPLSKGSYSNKNNSMLSDKSSQFQLQENYDVKYKIKQFEKIKADSLYTFNSGINNCPSYTKLANDCYIRNSSLSHIDERVTKLAPKAPNDFPSIKFKELKSIFECSNKN